MKRKVFRCGVLIVLVSALFTLTACQKEEPIEEKEEKVKDLIIKTDDTEILEDEEDSDQITEGTDRTAEDAAAHPVLDDLTEQIRAFVAPIANTGAEVSVYVENLSTGGQASADSHPMQSASLIKLYIAGCVYEQLDAVRSQETYAGETEELLRLMITISDNDSANVLVTRLGVGNSSAGMAAVNQYCQSHGFTDTHMGRLLLAPNDVDDNYTSVNDCGKFLREIYGNVLPGSEQIAALMRQQERTGKIPAGVPKGVITANKTGELSDVENDAAIIFGENSTYIVCVMMSGLSDTFAARNVITELSAYVYQSMNG